MRKRSSSTAWVAGAVLLLAGTVLAGDHWLSSSRSPIDVGGGGLSNRAGTPGDGRIGDSPIDIVVSLHNDPQPGPERAPYERILEYFADGVFEATNGAHRIGKVRIYRNYRFADRADIVWGDSGWPRAIPNGMGIRGQHIYMYDRFDGMYFLAGDEEHARGGYTLAHNWAHYAYGLYDEHQGAATSGPPDDSVPRIGDIPVIPSIMNDALAAATGNDTDRFAWLNFSIPYENPPGEFATTQATAQHRMHAASGWETLARPPADDPRSGSLLSQAKRISWPALVQAAPTPPDRWNRDLPSIDARSELEIIWMESQVVYEIILDRSGSMRSEEKLEHAKTAVSWLIDRVELGSSLGIVIYDTVVEIAHVIVTIHSEAERQSLRDSVAQITHRGSTAIGEAARTGLDEVTGFSSEVSNRVVFLLSDGLHNTGVHPLDVIPDYVAAGVPMFTFGYGSDANEALLRKLAEVTGGRYYFSPTTLADITGVFIDANQQVARAVSIASGTATVGAQDREELEFAVDSTLSDIAVVVSYVGMIGDASLQLSPPGGGTVGPTNTVQSGDSVQVRFRVETPAIGIWQLSISSHTSRPLEAAYIVDAVPKDDVTYALSLTNLTGQAVQYPQPVVLLAVLEKERAIRGAGVRALVKAPDGSTAEVVFRDDGEAPDADADDGRYSANFDYGMDGEHRVFVHVNNQSGTARLTSVGLAAVGEEGGAEDPTPDVPVAEFFSRSAVQQITVSGVLTDDHGDSPSAGTMIPPDNADTPGRIDFGGDVDVFSVGTPEGAVLMNLRVTDLSPGMEADMRVLASDGETELGHRSTVSGARGDHYLVVEVAGQPNSVVYAEVQHVNPDGMGTYNVSAGYALGSDISDRDGDGVADDEDACPHTPPGQSVDWAGCSRDENDRDGDGIPNWQDACPDTPPGEPIDSLGCSDSEADADRDEVLDEIDRCLGTPAGQIVDADGCSAWQLADDDGDGILNYRDECPNTEPRAVVTVLGCSCEEFDDDDDGVINCDDYCPETPAEEQADGLGCSCSQRDEDGDDVDDCADQCPGTLIGAPVDGDGCPPGGVEERAAENPVQPANGPTICGAIGMANLTAMLAGLSLMRASVIRRRRVARVFRPGGLI